MMTQSVKPWRIADSIGSDVDASQMAAVHFTYYRWSDRCDHNITMWDWHLVWSVRSTSHVIHKIQSRSRNRCDHEIYIARILLPVVTPLMIPCTADHKIVVQSMRHNCTIDPYCYKKWRVLVQSMLPRYWRVVDSAIHNGTTSDWVIHGCCGKCTTFIQSDTSQTASQST